MDSYQYNIHEIALYPATDTSNSIAVDAATLINFDLIDNFTKNGSASSASLQTTSSARIGTQMFVLPSGNASAGYIESIIDNNSLQFLDTFSSRDVFKLALINTSSNNTGASVSFRFFTDDSNYYTLQFLTGTASTYYVASVQKGDAAISGTPSWDSISKIRIWNGSTQDVKLDAIKIDVGSYLIDTNFGMISRAKLFNPIFKPSSVPLTVQYSLVVNFDGGI